MDDLNLTEEEIQALQDFDRFLALDEDKLAEMMKQGKKTPKEEEEEEDNEDDDDDDDEESEEEDEDEDEQPQRDRKGKKGRSLSEYFAGRTAPDDEEEDGGGAGAGAGGEEQGDDHLKRKTKPQPAPLLSTRSISTFATLRKGVTKEQEEASIRAWQEARGMFFEAKVFSLAIQQVTADVFYVDISEFGLRIRHPHNGLVMRSFPIRGIQRCSFFS